MEVPESFEEEEGGADVPEESEERVEIDASAGIESASTSRICLLELPSFYQFPLRYIYHQCALMSGRGQDNINISTASRGIPACQHNSVLRIENGKDGCLYFTHMSISFSIRSPRPMLLQDMIYLWQDVVGWHRIDSFLDGMMVLIMKPNQKLAAILKSIFSIGTPALIHRRVVSKTNGPNHPFNSSRD